MYMYDYLVAYNFSAEGYLTHCSGTMMISREKKITTFDDVNAVINFITEKLNENDNLKSVSNVSIYNFILLGRNKH